MLTQNEIETQTYLYTAPSTLEREVIVDELLTAYRQLIEARRLTDTPAQVNERCAQLEALMLEMDAQGLDFSLEYLNLVQ